MPATTYDRRWPSATALDDATRLREEDPFTDRLTSVGGSTVVVHRSRFEVDLNRPRDEAVYRTPEDAWGLELWRETPPAEEIERSRDLYDDFYVELGRRLDALADRGPFVVLDLHSYNHRRDGADAPPAPDATNPEVNVGTGALDRVRWSRVVDRFLETLAAQEVRRSPTRRSGERSLSRRRAQSLGRPALRAKRMRAGDRVQEGVHGRVDRRTG